MHYQKRKRIEKKQIKMVQEKDQRGDILSISSILMGCTITIYQCN